MISTRERPSVNFQRIAMDELPKYHVIAGTMRSGTTLLGHLLAEVGWVRYAGESHVVHDGPDAVRTAWETVRSALPEEQLHQKLPICDKVLVPAQMPDEARWLLDNAEHIYLLLRHPLAVWRSLTSLRWEWARWDYLIPQLRAMKNLAERCSQERMTVISYDQLTVAQKRREFFGQEITSYALLPQTGADHWGDPEPLIRSGEIREMTLREDLARAFAEVGDVVHDRGYQEALAVYSQLVTKVGREDLLEETRRFSPMAGKQLANKYVGLKKWGWYLDPRDWQRLFFTDKPVRALEIGAFDGVSANLMLDLLFPNPESRVFCIDPFLPDPTTPEVCDQTRRDFFENRKRGGHEEQIELFEGLSVEVLAWMIAEEGFWDSFDFIYIDGSHLARDVLTDAVMSWNLLKYGGVIAFDDYEWQGGEGQLNRPRLGIDAFESVFAPELKLIKGGYRRIWQKVPSTGG